MCGQTEITGNGRIGEYRLRAAEDYSRKKLIAHIQMSEVIDWAKRSQKVDIWDEKARIAKPARIL